MYFHRMHSLLVHSMVHHLGCNFLEICRLKILAGDWLWDLNLQFPDDMSVALPTELSRPTT